MNSKEIELVLKARLEASDAANDAAQVGTQLSTAFEQAFNGLGERMAQKFAEDFKAKLGNLDMFGSLGAGGGRNTALPSGAPEGFIQASQPALRPGANNDFDSRKNEMFTRANTERIGSGGGFSPFSSSAEFGGGQRLGGVATLLASSFEKVKGVDSKDLFGVSEEAAKQMDDKLNRFRLYSQTSKFNPGARMEEFGISHREMQDLRTELQALGTKAGKELASSKLDERIAALTEALNRNKDAYEKAVQTPANQRTESQQLLVERMQEAIDKRSTLVGTKADLKDVLRDVGAQVKDLPGEAPQALPWYRNRQSLQRAGMATAVAGEAMSFLGNFNYSSLSGQAGAAEVAGMSTRDMMSGDYSRMLAAQFGGGYDAMKSRARFGAGADIAGGLVSGVGQTIFGALSSETGVGALVGLNGTRQILSSGKDITEYENAVAQKMRLEQNLQYGRNQEWIDMYGKARANAQGSYNDAIGMGSDQYAQFLTGMNENGGGVYDMSRNSGLSRGQIAAGLRTYAQGMGGVYRGTNVLEGGSVTDQIVRLNNLKGEGFANAEQVASGMFQGGFYGASPEMDRARAMREAGDRYISYRGTGLEEGGLVALEGSMAARAGQGLGMAYGAGFNADASVAFAADNGLRNGNQVGFVNRTLTNMMDASNTGSGMNGIGKMRAVRDLERRLGRPLTKAERIKLTLGEVGEQGMADIMGVRLTGNADDPNLKSVRGMLGGFRNDINSEQQRMWTRAAGGDEEVAATFRGREVGGARTYEEMDIAAKLGVSALGAPERMPEDLERAIRGGKTPPGKREQQQEAGQEIDQLQSGMKTLNEGFNALEVAARDAATRLKNIADLPVPSAQDMGAVGEEYVNNGVGGAFGRRLRRGYLNSFGAEHTPDWATSDWQEKNRGRNGKAQGPKGSDGGGHSE